MSLERKTPLKRKRSTPRRVPELSCSIQRCTKPPRVFHWCAMHARREADRLFSLYIRKRDGSCRVCGLDTDLQAAHLISRRYFAVRWDPINCVALCRFDHKKFTENPLAWDRWCTERLGPEAWGALRFKAERGGMPDVAFIIETLRSRLEAMEAA